MTQKEIQKCLEVLSGWRYIPKNNTIDTELKTKDFLEAVGLIKKIAVLAEKANHHPDLHLTRYRHLKVVLSTHSLGQVTRKDFVLASKIQKLFAGCQNQYRRV